MLSRLSLRMRFRSWLMLLLFVACTVGSRVEATMVGAHDVWLANGRSAEQIRARLDRLKDGGGEWLRLAFDWPSIERQPGVFVFQQSPRLSYDTVLAETSKRNIQILGLFSSGNNAVQEPATSLPRSCTGESWPETKLKSPNDWSEADFEAWETFIRKVLERYGQVVTTWEIWNEPNLMTYWHGPEACSPFDALSNQQYLRKNARGYVRLLKRASKTIRDYYDIHFPEQKSQLKIVSGGIEKFPWLDSGAYVPTLKYLDHLKAELTAQDAWSAFDAFGEHPYRDRSPFQVVNDAATGEVHDTLENDLVRLEQEYAGGKPIWITEVNWPSQDPSNPETGQEERSGWLVGTYEIANRLPFVQNVLWYSLIDESGQGSDGSGLLKADLSPRQKYYAYQYATGRRQFVSFVDHKEYEHSGPYDVDERFDTLSPGYQSRLYSVQKCVTDPEFKIFAWATYETDNNQGIKSTNIHISADKKCLNVDFDMQARAGYPGHFHRRFYLFASNPTIDKINDLVTFTPLSSSYRFSNDARGCPAGFAGTFKFNARMMNVTNSVLQWTSRSDGDFAIARFSPGGTYASNIGRWEAGDWNGDGKTDLIHIITDSDYTHPWISKGDGSFDIKTFRLPAYGMGVGAWETGDWNGDGKTDLLHLITTADYTHPWYSNGDGTFNVLGFSPQPGYVMGAGKWSTGDWNGDGKTDLLHIITTADYTHPWYSNGNGTFNVLGFSPWSGYGMGVGTWLTGDWNGDGKTDLIHIITGSDYTHPWLSKGDGTFNVVTFPQPGNGYGVGLGKWLTGDINGDGKTDLLHLITESDNVNLWTSKGDGTFRIDEFNPSGTGDYLMLGQWFNGDFNGDGKTDLVHINATNGQLVVWLSNGDGSFELKRITPPAPSYRTLQGVWRTGDFNGDGKTDLLQFEAIKNLHALKAVVASISGGNLLKNADGGPAGSGATLTVPFRDGYSDQELKLGESVDVPLEICVKKREPFTFYVNVNGWAWDQ